ncbi:hypothetical protein AYI69_g7140 [Smittium culicis]|uniref:DNA-directed RNA polymerase III subunit n=1 Tax=Smittium culicis TaxID=133412 RepID=A0A1R1XRL8_9FUNG|nr:hypothetical protein AYI69_g8554 [Smittium culicis]OMJ17268.1 hypothetical protein AYI69_g7492 [Smittium culicis]OMJ18146.1 hypothetical protein AYI69_g7140 [Smittium culicis]
MSRGGRGGGASKFQQNALLKELGAGNFFKKGNDTFSDNFNVPVPKKPLYEEKHVSNLLTEYMERLADSQYFLKEPPPPKVNSNNSDILNELKGEEEGSDENNSEEEEVDAAWEEDEEEENDYIDNYFDNGEGDDNDIDEDDGTAGFT